MMESFALLERLLVWPLDSIDAQGRRWNERRWCAVFSCSPSWLMLLASVLTSFAPDPTTPGAIRVCAVAALHLLDADGGHVQGQVQRLQRIRTRRPQRKEKS